LPPESGYMPPAESASGHGGPTPILAARPRADTYSLGRCMRRKLPNPCGQGSGKQACTRTNRHTCRRTMMGSNFIGGVREMRLRRRYCPRIRNDASDCSDNRRQKSANRYGVMGPGNQVQSYTRRGRPRPRNILQKVTRVRSTAVSAASGRYDATRARAEKVLLLENTITVTDTGNWQAWGLVRNEKTEDVGNVV